MQGLEKILRGAAPTLRHLRFSLWAVKTGSIETPCALYESLCEALRLPVSLQSLELDTPGLSKHAGSPEKKRETACGRHPGR